MKALSLSILLGFLWSYHLVAQTEEHLLRGTEKPGFKQKLSETAKCFVYRNYVVKTVFKNNEAGEDVTIYQRDAKINPKDSCEADLKVILNLPKNYSGKTDYDGADEISSNFDGIRGKYLFIRKDVEPFQGAFELFDLTTGKSVFKAEMYPDYKILQNRFLFYENWSEKDGWLKNCKEARQIKKQGLGIGWVVKRQLDLQTFKIKNLGLRCEPVQ